MLLRNKWLCQFNLFLPPVSFDAQVVEEPRVIYQVRA